MVKRIFKCFECKHTWEVEFGIPRPPECPECGSTSIHRDDNDNHRFHRHRGRQRNRSYGRDHK